MSSVSFEGFRSILAAYDGSDSSLRACEVAALLAKKYASKLVVAFATSPVDIYSSPLRTEYYAAVDSSAAKWVERALALCLKHGVEAKGAVLHAQSSIVRAIVDYAADNGCDLIVAGTRGLGGFRRMLVGSVSSGLVSHAPCPVLVVRQREPKNFAIRSVLAAADGSKGATRAAGIAASLAKALGANLTAINIVHLSPFIYSSIDAPIDEMEEEAQREGERAVDEAVSIAKKYDVNAKRVVITDSKPPVPAITDYASKNDVDLIVLGTRGLGGFKKLVLGSVANGVLNYAHCSVLVTR